jgi:predicted ribosome quality control (RQC) complex YloA/Tae2 family protein
VHTDWLIVRRLAAELDRALRSARIREVGFTPDGRLALRVRARGAGGDALVIDAFGQLPSVSLELGLEVGAHPGWPRAIADAVRGMRIERVRSRRGDRLIAIDVATQSRFGVLSSYRIVAELVPRFGNVLLLRDDVVVAAAREFTRVQNPRRAVIVGERYSPPPLPEAKPNPPDLSVLLARLVAGGAAAGDIDAAVRALRAHVPLLPQMVAASLVAEAARADGASVQVAGVRMLAGAASLVGAAEDEPGDREALFVYRDGAKLVQAHVVPLRQFASFAETREPELLSVLGEALLSERSEGATRSADARRASLEGRIAKRRAALEGERLKLELERGESAAAEGLREQGDLLYAHHAEVTRGATSFVVPGAQGVTIPLDPELDGKANAAAIFRRYRKTVAKRGHVERRLAQNAAEMQAAEELAWEVERADDSALDELRDEADRLERRAPSRSGARVQPRRTALEVPLSVDARVLVGRSPRDNADLTFRVARPDDLWFHARGVPGAHVVLRIDSLRQPTSAELQSAAELAAYHSKARTSGTVPVDYTARKYVRKQQNALPGLVWYTNAKTIDVTPRAAR